MHMAESPGCAPRDWDVPGCGAGGKAQAELWPAQLRVPSQLNIALFCFISAANSLLWEKQLYPCAAPPGAAGSEPVSHLSSHSSSPCRRE